MSKANRNRASAPALAVSTMYTTSPEVDEQLHTRRLQAESRRNRAQHVKALEDTKVAQHNPMPYLTEPATRPGADDALAIPSRTGDRLTYRDGRVAFLNGDAQ